MRATIKMIAEKAGVSIGTVDRVLHDRPYVKAEVRERVLQVMEELEYRPNRMASALAMSGTARRLAFIQPGWIRASLRAVPLMARALAMRLGRYSSSSMT